VTRFWIVLPAYDEERSLPALLERYVALGAELGRRGAEMRVIVVDDGSRDGTADIARRGAPGASPPVVIVLPTNRGKGAAVRAGVAASTGESVLVMDADLATDLSGLDDFVKLLVDYDVVVGSRAVAGATVRNTTWSRTLMGRTFNRMVRVLTRLEVHDSQCGFKAFRGDAARLVFSLSRVDGFAFDPEVLMIARALGLRIVEVPVEWTAVDGSSVRPLRDSFVTGAALLGLVLRIRPARVRDAARARGWVAAPADS